MKYPFSPDILDAIPEELAELFRGLELQLLQEITKRLLAAGELNEVAVQNIRALRSHGISVEEIKKAILKATGISEKKLDEILKDVVKRNQRYYKELIDIAKVTEPQTLVKENDVDKIIRQTKNELENITRTMGFVVDHGRTKLKPTQVYRWALDNAAMQIQSGGISYNRAVANATQELADSGLSVISYESGHKDQVDVAVRRAVMTGVNQLNSQYAEESLDYLETEYVEVSAHSGARDKDGPLGWENHKKWQGKVYWWKEKSKGEPEHKYPEFEKTCGYGSVTGILGANCRHNYSPFIPGVMERTYTDEQLENIDPKPFVYQGKKYTHYEATQKQREIERTIRKWKRREAAAANDEDRQAAQIRIQRLNKEYREFSKAANLRMQPERMKAYTPANAVRGQGAGVNDHAIEEGVPVQIGEVDFSDKGAVMQALREAEKECVNLPYEVNTTVTRDGKIWRVSGINAQVNPFGIPSDLSGNYSYHNHPIDDTHCSLSGEDIRYFYESKQEYSLASDMEYEYYMKRTAETIEVDKDWVFTRFHDIYYSEDVMGLSEKGVIDIDLHGYHLTMKKLAEELKFEYGRKKKHQ